MITLSLWIHTSCFNFKREVWVWLWSLCISAQQWKTTPPNSPTKVSRFSNETWCVVGHCTHWRLWIKEGRRRGEECRAKCHVPRCAFALVLGPCQIVFTFLKDVSPLEAWEWMENSFLQQRLVNHSTFILLPCGDLSPARRTMAPSKTADEFDSQQGLIYWARQYC